MLQLAAFWKSVHSGLVFGGSESIMLQNDPVVALTPEVVAWRHHVHSNPELGFNEHETARFAAEKLRSFGFDEVHEAIGGTGVVGVLRGGTGTHTIGLRAELDALPVVEK